LKRQFEGFLERGVEPTLLIKYCGNRSVSDIKACAGSLADYIGFIFAPSKRQVKADQVKQWLNELNLVDKKLVGVFVNAPIYEIEKTVKELSLSIIQCHGTETPSQIGAMKEQIGVPIWKAFHHCEGLVTTMAQYSGIVDGHIIDTKVQGAWGGTGISFDWRYVPYYIEEAERQGVTCFIAGGIRAENIEQLLSYQPHGIDISSGIEDDRGKSKRKIETIERKVKLYGASSKSNGKIR